MPKVVLDSNFIITCVRKKIDFFSDLEAEGLQIVIPKQVLQEIGKLSETDNSTLRREAKLALEIIHKNDYKKVTLETHSVDLGIAKLAKKSPTLVIATLDSKLRMKIKNRKISIRKDGKIEL